MGRALQLRRARQRRHTSRTLLEGPHLLSAAVAVRAPVLEVFGLPDDETSRSLAREGGAEWIPVTSAVLDRLAPTEHPRGPVAVMALPPQEPPRRDLVWLEVADPGNAGTLVRTAAAFDLDVAAAPGAVDLWSPKVLRAASGAHFSTAVITNLTTPPPGHGIIATVARGGEDPHRFPDLLDPARGWTIRVGGEARGLEPEAVADADIVVTIPMRTSVESLNAAVAGAIVAYELARWRGADEGPPSPD